MFDKGGNGAVLRLIFFPNDIGILPYFGGERHEFQILVRVVFHRAVYGEHLRLVLQGEESGVVYNVESRRHFQLVVLLAQSIAI